jgi:CheY-like chemotaxis protein/HPt (histidine-containing phosphotransfer) domain-containing protein
VLVVDDVESNLYVAQGLLAPYGLSVDVAISGYAAIDKVKAGNVYDVIFMDHMMPKMDGIEATQIIRGLGYTAPIVAVTSNVISGQSDVFLAHGFDDFVSKPIDVRLMDAVLKKYVRNKQSSGIINPANPKEKPQKKDEVVKKTEPLPQNSPPLSPLLIDCFLQDARRILATLEALHEKRNNYEDKDMKTYTINVHGMKSALAYVGETELSAFAAQLEQAGRANDTAAISSGTPAFLDALRAVIEKLA